MGADFGGSTSKAVKDSARIYVSILGPKHSELNVIEPAVTVSVGGPRSPAEAVFSQDLTTDAYAVNVFETDFVLVEVAGGAERARVDDPPAVVRRGTMKGGEDEGVPDDQRATGVEVLSLKGQNFATLLIGEQFLQVVEIKRRDVAGVGVNYGGRSSLIFSRHWCNVTR